MDRTSQKTICSEDATIFLFNKNKNFVFDVEKDVKVTMYDVRTENSVSDITVNLAGSGAQGNVYGLFIGNEEQHFGMRHTIIHSAPHTTSDLLTKGVLDDKAKASYSSLIKIQEGATAADGAQKEDTLLLSRDAKIHAVPNLEVAHNDVKCSHAVTTTNVDKEKLFFMNSRGIETDEAVRELVWGHLGVILDKMDEDTRGKIQEIIMQKMK